ncbi:MAG: hypothetical protein GY883_07205 [Shimia sp.]|nr:hypothetical protein [Shimia sp.]
MHPDLKNRHRLFLQASQSYLKADLAWRHSLRRARALMPGEMSRKISSYGAPGSSVRRLYEDRDKALERLQVARLKYAVARARLARRQSFDAIAAPYQT